MKPTELEKGKSVVLPPKLFEDRPDYSSTTSESDNNGYSPATDAKFFLSSDIPAGTNNQIPTTSLDGNQSRVFQKLVLNKDNYGKPTVSQDYTRCVHCLRYHQHCDRLLPKCSKRVTESGCVYLKKGVYDTVTKTVRAWEAASGSKRRSVSRSVIPEPKPSADMRVDDTTLKAATQASPKQIFWIDGDISNSQRSCPKPILRLITKYLTEFEKEVLTARWPPDKTVDTDRGRTAFHVHMETNEKIPLARYHYGRNSQFFVAWIPGQTTNDAPEPAICKFSVYNGLVIERDEQSWKAITWKTWAPREVSQNSHTIYRCIPDNGSGRRVNVHNSAVRQKRVSESAADRLASYAPSDDNNGLLDRMAVTTFNRSFSTADGSLKRKRAESIDLDESGPSELVSAGLRSLPDSGGRASSHFDPPQNPHVTRSSVRLLNGQSVSKDGYKPGGEGGGRALAVTEKIDPSNNSRASQYVARKLKKEGPNVTCIFRDKDGNEKGIYPYDECDTAQKLCDVACVAQIAQIEPPATRLLKISFDGGGEG